MQISYQTFQRLDTITARCVQSNVNLGWIEKTTQQKLFEHSITMV